MNRAIATSTFSDFRQTNIRVRSLDFSGFSYRFVNIQVEYLVFNWISDDWMSMIILYIIWFSFLQIQVQNWLIFEIVFTWEMQFEHWFLYHTKQKRRRKATKTHELKSSIILSHIWFTDETNSNKWNSHVEIQIPKNSFSERNNNNNVWKMKWLICTHVFDELRLSGRFFHIYF